MRSITLFLLLVAGTLVAAAQDTPEMVNNPESRVWITSINSNLQDMLQMVEVQNRSNKAIVAYQFGVVMTVPEACGFTQIPTVGQEQIFSVDEANIAPGASNRGYNYQESLDRFKDFAVQNSARYVHSQISVTQIRFADGTSWSIAPHPGSPYSTRLMRESGELNCTSSTKAAKARQAAMRHCTALHKVGYPSGGGVQTYSCVASPNFEQCAVGQGGQSCLSSFCNGGCPYQKCQAGNTPVPPAGP